MYEIDQTDHYRRWFAQLADERAKARIDAWVFRLSLGNAGDAKPVGEGVSELRIDYGPGYRLYFTRKGKRLLLLLCGGDKSSQDRDIRAAKALLQEL